MKHLEKLTTITLTVKSIMINRPAFNCPSAFQFHDEKQGATQI